MIVRFDSISLDSGATLAPVDVAYETYGELNATKSNALLVLHAFSGDAHAAGIDEAWLESATTVGVTSGASVPDELVGQVLGRLAEAGFADVHEAEAVRESMEFALPRELRQPRRG